MDQTHEVIGRGGNGIVYSCTVNGWMCAMKTVDMTVLLFIRVWQHLMHSQAISEVQQAFLLSEIKLLEKLPYHPNIVRYSTLIILLWSLPKKVFVSWARWQKATPVYDSIYVHSCWLHSREAKGHWILWFVSDCPNHGWYCTRSQVPAHTFGSIHRHLQPNARKIGYS